jgi:hypothetical protein
MDTDVAQSAIRAAWPLLSVQSIRGQELAGRRPIEGSLGTLLCALNRAGNRIFLIVLGDSDDDLTDDKSRGLSVSTQQLEVAGESVRRYLSVQCSDSSAYDLFDVVGADLLVAVSNAPGAPREAVKLVLDRWKRFWSDLPRSVMTDEQIAGLFGELWFIHIWLSVAVGMQKAIAVWRGPFGARHDFEAKGLSIEAKTTTARVGRRHRITGVEQLEQPENGRLFLFSVVIHREGGATNSLAVLIDAIRALLQHDPDTANVFDNALARVGYSDAFRAYYSERTYRVVDCILFEVGGSFPRLTKQQLIGALLMPGVSALEYDVELDGFRSLALADNPESAIQHLRWLRV